MPTVHLLIKGRVQGVYYRVSARERALALGLRGWVRNTAEGDVELVATGEATRIEALVDWCHRGPRGARVTEVRRTDRADEAFEDFVVRRGE